MTGEENGERCMCGPKARAIRIESGDLQPSGAIVGRVDRRVERYTVWIDLPDLIAGDTTAKEGNQ